MTYQKSAKSVRPTKMVAKTIYIALAEQMLLIYTFFHWDTHWGSPSRGCETIPWHLNHPNWYLVTSIDHWTSLSVDKLLGSAAWAIPRFAASWRTTESVTSRPAEAGNLSRTLELSTLAPDVTALLREAHSEYIPPFSDSFRINSCFKDLQVDF